MKTHFVPYKVLFTNFLSIKHFYKIEDMLFFRPYYALWLDKLSQNQSVL